MSNDLERGRVGSSFDDFLCGEGTLEKTTSTAIKRVVAFQIAAAMKQQRISKVEMAERLDTSWLQLDRLLDPDNDTVQLRTLARAAKAAGRHLRVELH